MISAAGEAAVLLVAEPKRDERRLLELGRELALRPVVELRERLSETGHLERPLPEVVRLLRIEEENAMRDFRLRHDERHDRSRAELFPRAKTMVAIRGPVFPVAGRHRDNGIEISVQLVDRIRDALDMCLGQIALVRRRLDAIERQR